MKILFVAPRFHTNQYPTTKELIAHGHEVFYLVQAVDVSEDHKFVEPAAMKLSWLGRRVRKKLERHHTPLEVEGIMIEKFIPSFSSVYSYMKKIRPDIVILRDRTSSSIVSNICCKLLGIKAVILYNQHPLYTYRSAKVSLKRRIVRAFLPKVRYTITYIRYIYDLKERPEDLYIKEHEYFVPYVCPPVAEAAGRDYLAPDGTLRLLCVGKFRRYKNQRVLVDALDILNRAGKLSKISLTMLGQVSCDEDRQYLEDLKKYITEKELDSCIELRHNIPYSEMKNLYREHDVFILPSIDELGSISILESMANAIPPVSTSSNGTAWYIKEGETGLIFRTCDPESLAERIDELSRDRARVGEMGRAGYAYVGENCMFGNYYRALNGLLMKEFNISLDSGKA